MPKAFLFDMDGTLVDNMNYHLEAWKEIAKEAGSTKSGEEIYSLVYGKNTEILLRILDDRELSHEVLHEMVAKKDQRYRELYRPHLKLIEGLDKFLAEAKEAGISMAVASGSTPENVDLVLDGLDLTHFFDAIVTGDEVTKSKPDPSTFTQAAQKLGIPAEDCIVFEDVPQGVEAAAAGGMKAVAILTTHPKKAFESYPNLLEIITDYRFAKVDELIYLARPI